MKDYEQIPISEEEIDEKRKPHSYARNSNWSCKMLLQIISSVATHCTLKHFNHIQENNNENNVIYCVIFCFIWYAIKNNA